MLNQLSRIDLPLFFLNALLLLTISFIPFPSGLLGLYPGNALAVAVPGFVLAVSGLALALIRYYASKRLLLVARADYALFNRILKQQLVVGPVLYTIAASSAWISPIISFVLYIGIPVFFMVSPTQSKASEASNSEGTGG